jgi:hypothetical protein
MFTRVWLCLLGSCKYGASVVSLHTIANLAERVVAKTTLKFKPVSGEHERLVFAEVLVPDERNVYGDLHTAENIRQFAYGFMINGFQIDLDHDNKDVSDKIRVVESFIAREGDSTFITGAWVIGILVLDDKIWGDILSGELNGFSYEALVSSLEVGVVYPNLTEARGVTYPSILDGHVHSFSVELDDFGRVVRGETADSVGHLHTIASHTYTDLAADEAGRVHRHRYTLFANVKEQLNG